MPLQIVALVVADRTSRLICPIGAQNTIIRYCHHLPSVFS